MDTAVFEALLPSISFVTVEIFAFGVGRKMTNAFERFLEWFLDYDGIDDEETGPRRPTFTKVALKSGGWCATFLCVSIAIVVWAIVMRGWFWVPPWFETYWQFIAAGCVIVCGGTGLIASVSTLAAKFS